LHDSGNETVAEEFVKSNKFEGFKFD